MKLSDYLKDRIYVILLNIICAFVLALFLLGVDLSANLIILIITFWGIVLISYLLICFYFKRRHFDELDSIMNSLDQKYLFSEIIDRPKNLDDKFYYQLIRNSNKSMLEHVSRHQVQLNDYKEYIEQWIHEIKVPITSAKLICENNKDDNTRKLLTQLERIDNDVERALYFARMEYVANDYIIKETLLNDVVTGVISRNKQLLIASRIQITTADLDIKVHTDSKWLEFILNQIVSNSIKYKADKKPCISISAGTFEHSAALYIKDNGVGIEESEIDRIFQKGFTGSNGRTEAKSTGIGLYLCKKLCRRLGIQIKAESSCGDGTLITLIFPDSSFLTKM